MADIRGFRGWGYQDLGVGSLGLGFQIPDTHLVPKNLYPKHEYQNPRHPVIDFLDLQRPKGPKPLYPNT